MSEHHERWIEHLAWDIAVEEGGSIHTARAKARQLVEENAAYIDEVEEALRDVREFWGRGVGMPLFPELVAGLDRLIDTITDFAKLFEPPSPPTRSQRFDAWVHRVLLERRWL